MSREIVFISAYTSNFEEISRLLAEFNQFVVFKTFQQAGIPHGERNLIDLDPGTTFSEKLSEPAKGLIKTAFTKLNTPNTNKPCFLELSGIQVEGSVFFTSSAFSGIGEQNFLQKFGGRKATSCVSVAYTSDGTNIQIFEGILQGTIVQEKPIGILGSGWDRIFIPDGYSKTLSEMFNYKFVVNARLKPYLELAFILRNHEYSGTFEVHITVESGNQEAEEKFRKLCIEQGCKSIMIELPKGQYNRQLMTSSYHRGSLKEVHNQAFQLSKVFAQNGFNISRTKIEAMYSNSGVPESDEEAKALSPENYFEFHIKVTLESEAAMEKLKEICSKHECHLSRNALKTFDNGMFQRFVTLRLYHVGKTTAGSRLDTLLKSIQDSQYKVDSIMREYSVYDSNVRLDVGWIDKETK